MVRGLSCERPLVFSSGSAEVKPILARKKGWCQWEKVKYLQSAYSGDHGQQKFCFASKLLLKYEETVHPAVYALADVACKKDTHIVLKGTVMDELIKD